MLSTSTFLKRHFSTITLKKDSNQAYELAKYAVDFLKNGRPSHQVYDRIKLAHTDAVLCGYSAVALKSSAPSIFKNEAMAGVRKGKSISRPKMGSAKVFGTLEAGNAEKAIVACVSAVREFSANPATFGYNKSLPTHQAGELASTEFYPLVVATAQQNLAITGDKVVKGLVLLDEIQGRLCEAFPLRNYNIDSSLYSAMSAAVTYGALLGGTPSQIENALGILVSHSVPYASVRRGRQLTETEGAASAIMIGDAVTAATRALGGLSGPTDIFRNPYGLFRNLVKTEGDTSPFDLVLTQEGNGFSTMGNHFRFGSYNMHAAGAIEGVLRILKDHQFLVQDDPSNIQSIKIVGHQAGVDAIGGQERRDPLTRQSAINSIYYIIATTLKKAISIPNFQQKGHNNIDDLWRELVLDPQDYTVSSLEHPTTKNLMEKITYEAGGQDFDAKFPDGIPTTVTIKLKDGRELNSELVMYPAGHARNTTSKTKELLKHKFEKYTKMSVHPNDISRLMERLESLNELTNTELQMVYGSPIKYADRSIEDPHE